MFFVCLFFKYRVGNNVEIIINPNLIPVQSDVMVHHVITGLKRITTYFVRIALVRHHNNITDVIARTGFSLQMTRCPCKYLKNIFLSHSHNYVAEKT